MRQKVGRDKAFRILYSLLRSLGFILSHWKAAESLNKESDVIGFVFWGFYSGEWMSEEWE